MSRLIVKNLPKYFTEDNLRDHFGKKYPDITDVKLMKSRNGESRKFAFLGFKNQNDAENAVKYFNGSFIHTARISVQLAKSFADPTVPKPVKEKIREKQQRLRDQEERLKQREEEFQKNKKRKLNVTEDIDKQIANNPKLKEFLEATKHSSKVRSWDDGILGDSNRHTVAEPVGIEEEKITVDQASDDEYEDFGSKNQQQQSANNDDGAEEPMMKLSDFSKDNDTANQERSDNQSKEIEEESVDTGEAVPEEKNTDPNISDLDWMQQRRRMIKDSQGYANEHTDKKPENVHPERQELREPAEPSLTQEEKTEQQILQTGRLFIRNIHYDSSEDDFKKLLQPFGEMEEVHIAIDTRTHKSKGFVYAQFKDPQDAVEAYRSLDKQIFQGRLLHILPGQEKKSHKLDEFDLKNLPLKKQRELKKKFEASKATFSWNSLFLNENAVLEAVADKIGVNKRDLVDPESSSSGVKQALAEAHVIGDVRKYFESKNIDLTSFNKKEKDDRVILVKNFPYNTTMSEISELFSQYGQLSRVLFPPTGAIAIIEFKDVTAGRAAFTKLAYRRFKKNILYLEKGPKDLFTSAPNEEEQLTATPTEKKEEVVKDAKMSVDDLLDTNKDDEKVGEDDDVVEFKGVTASVFVKNLNFKTTSQDLTDIFKPMDGFIVAKVQQKPDAKNPGKTLSMGFGFVEFRTKEQALACIKKNDGKVIDGHKVQLKLSHRKATATGSSTGKPEAGKSGKKSTKIIVKNLPFEATRKDVFELFNPFGHLKSVRVPKKFNKSARGFAFVEFNLVKEAENAIDSLRGVHLLGRRLNIEYAEKDAETAEEEIAKMTQKMKKQKNVTDYAKAAQLNGKRRVELDDNDDEV